jgi:hypothetical protein
VETGIKSVAFSGSVYLPQHCSTNKAQPAIAIELNEVHKEVQSAAAAAAAATHPAQCMGGSAPLPLPAPRLLAVSHRLAFIISVHTEGPDRTEYMYSRAINNIVLAAFNDRRTLQSVCRATFEVRNGRRVSQVCALTHEVQQDFLISQTTPASAKQALLLILLSW